MMEIERKFLIKEIPFAIDCYEKIEIEQGYLCTNPVLRIRRHGDSYIFTYKSSGLMTRQELEVPLTQESYQHLVPKCDGHLITKTRYRIPDADAKSSSQTHKLFIELDVFHGELDGLLSAEVEFDTEEEALSYSAPEWFTKEVTDISTFHNSQMSKTAPADILKQAHALLNSD